MTTYNDGATREECIRRQEPRGFEPVGRIPQVLAQGEGFLQVRSHPFLGERHDTPEKRRRCGKQKSWTSIEVPKPKRSAQKASWKLGKTLLLPEWGGCGGSDGPAGTRWGRCEPFKVEAAQRSASSKPRTLPVPPQPKMEDCKDGIFKQPPPEMPFQIPGKGKRVANDLWGTSQMSTCSWSLLYKGRSQMIQAGPTLLRNLDPMSPIRRVS